MFLLMQDEDNYSDNVREGLFNYNYDYGDNFVFQRLSWPTPNNITEGEAYDACDADLRQTLSLDTCEAFVNVSEIMQECIHDIQVNICNTVVLLLVMHSCDSWVLILLCRNK